MIQLNNIIYIDEGGVPTPHIVYERVSEFAKPQLKDGYKLVREQRSDGAFLLLCEPIRDAEWTDIPSEEEKMSTETKQVTQAAQTRGVGNHPFLFVQ